MPDDGSVWPRDRATVRWVSVRVPASTSLILASLLVLVLAPSPAGAGDPFLEAGDSTRNYEFDQHDLVLAQQAAKYLTGQPATWDEGDWDGAPGGGPSAPPVGNGFFDLNDVIEAIGTGNYRTGPYAGITDPTPPPPLITAGGTIGDGQTSIVYFPGSGEIRVDAPPSTFLTTLNLQSDSGVFTGSSANNLGGAFDADADDTIFKAAFNDSFGSLSFGNVAAIGLSEAFLLTDLRVSGSLAGGGGLGPVDLVVLPALRAGDSTQNYVVDQHDLVLTQQASRYLSGQAANWQQGDWDGAPGGGAGFPPAGNGLFDQADIIELISDGEYLQGPYAAGGTPTPAPPLILAGGAIGDGQTSIVYFSGSGEIRIDRPPSTELTTLNLQSDSDIFTGSPVNNLGGALDIDADDTVFKATFGSSFGSISFGDVAQTGLSEAFLLTDLRVNGSLAGGGGLGPVDLVVLPALRAGDSTQNYEVDQHDLVLTQQAGRYLSGQPANWQQGDWDGAPGGGAGFPPAGSGLFDQIDIVALLGAGDYLQGPYAAGGTPTPAPPLILAGGAIGDEQTSIVYFPPTGRVWVDAPASTELTTLNLQSDSGVFTGSPVNNLGGSLDIDADGTIFKAFFGASFGSISFGNVAADGLSEAFLLTDLRVSGSLAGGGGLGAVDLVIEPDPVFADGFESGDLGKTFVDGFEPGSRR